MGQSAPLYRLLSAHSSSAAEPVHEVDYNVSVDQYLDASRIRNVICQLIRSEKPAGYDVLSAGIYYKLERYVPGNEGEAVDIADRRDRRIAQYHWSKDAPKDSRRLAVSRDAKGQSLPDWRFYDFDHTKACK
jgi:hypothetical protein